MTAPDDPVSDEDLHAYVDGALPADRHLRVEAHLAVDPDAAARIAAWRRDGEALRRALAARFAEDVPARLGGLIARRGSWSAQAVAAGLAAALLVGSGIGWIAHGADVRHGLDGLTQQAAVADRVFAATAVDDPSGAASAAPLVGLDRDRPGLPVILPDLSRAGYTLLATRTVPTQQGSAILFSYRGRNGAHVSVLVRLMIGLDTDASLRAVQADGASGYAWSHHGIGYSIVSAIASPDLARLAHMLAAGTAVVG